jgi:hypothetical protein
MTPEKQDNYFDIWNDWTDTDGRKQSTRNTFVWVQPSWVGGTPFINICWSDFLARRDFRPIDSLTKEQINYYIQQAGNLIQAEKFITSRQGELVLDLLYKELAKKLE